MVGAAALLMAAAGGFQYYRRSRAHAAAEDFRKALALLSAGDVDAATAAFTSVAAVDPYASLAELYRGHAALRERDPAAAAAAFHGFLARPGMPPYLRQEALSNLGFAATLQGDARAAVRHYEDAAGIPGPYQVDARLAAAHVHETLGETEKARPLYELVAADEDQQFARLAAMRLEALGHSTEEPAKTASSEDSG
jgi:hypothetical protein